MDSELWAPLGQGGRCSPGLTDVRKGQYTHARAHTLTPDTRRLTRGLGAGKQEGPFNMWPSTGTVVNGLWAAALPCPVLGSCLEGVCCSWAGARPPIVFFPFTLYRLPACHPHTHFI